MSEWPFNIPVKDIMWASKFEVYLRKAMLDNRDVIKKHPRQARKELVEIFSLSATYPFSACPPCVEQVEQAYDRILGEIQHE